MSACDNKRYMIAERDQRGFTLIEISLVILILAMLIMMFYSGANSAKDGRLAKAAIFEAREIVQLAEECRNKSSSTFINVDGVYENTYLIPDDGTMDLVNGSVSSMLTLCGFDAKPADNTPFDYGGKYLVSINKNGTSVKFPIPIENFSFPNTSVVNVNGVEMILVESQRRAGNSFGFTSRALLDKKLFFKEIIER